MSESTLASLFFGIYFLLVLPFFLWGVPYGFAALGYACWGKREQAERLGWRCVAVGGVLGFWLAAVSVGLKFPYPWIFGAPAAIGGMALAHAHVFRNVPQPTGYQFTLPMLLYATFFVSILAAAANYWLDDPTDYSIRAEYAANMGRMKSIADVRFSGYTNQTPPARFVVTEIQFSLAGRPDTHVRIIADERLRTCEAGDPLSDLVLCELGDWRLRGMLQVDPKISLPLEGLNIGSRGDLESEIPFPLNSIDDLAAHYDELDELLKTWPRADQPKRVEGNRAPYDYWVERNGP